jgi:hypothetical protein
MLESHNQESISRESINILLKNKKNNFHRIIKNTSPHPRFWRLTVGSDITTPVPVPNQPILHQAVVFNRPKL